MKNFKYIFLFILGGFIIPSCVDDTAPEDAFGQGPNLASFNNASSNFTVVATGEEFVQNVQMKVKGPSTSSISGPVTVTVSVDPSSTAIEGLHFRLDQPTIEISPDNNLLGLLPVTILTEGLEPPLVETPVLVLSVSSVSGAGNVIENGKKININLLYLCDSQVQGTYDVTMEFYLNGAYQRTINYTDVITKTGDGEYRTSRVGHWTAEQLGGTPGFTFLDVCDEITIPEQNLVDLYANIVEGVVGASEIDPVTDNIYMEYTVCFGGSCREYYVDYVKQ